MKFKLTLDAKPSKYSIAYQDKLMLIGSCFTENIGAKFNAHLFEVMENPHGILFNPMSVEQSIFDCIHNKQYTANDLFKLNDVWNSWNHHSRFSSVHQEDALTKINTSIHKAHLFLKTANHLVITLGSAWLYQLTALAPLSDGQVVANNHKAPASWFTKSLMPPDNLKERLSNLVHALLEFNSELHIVFTISPVRHLREGLVENNRSKAVLIHAVHEVIATMNQVEYFPAYEYVIDDLRDYRFYSEDLVHPNYAASGYVWEKLVETYMKDTTQVIMKQVAELQLAVNHKPFFAGSAEHQKFTQSCIDKTERLIQSYPNLPLQKHLEFFRSAIAK